MPFAVNSLFIDSVFLSFELLLLVPLRSNILPVLVNIREGSWRALGRKKKGLN
jgi:hypothetical protein